ncbi:helix-turn-helix domain-containing protein [Methylovorus mays]
MKGRGAYAGRKPTLSTERIAELMARDKANGHKNRAALARDFGISRETLYQYLRAREGIVEVSP